MTVNSVEAFERLLRVFTRIAYAGGLLIAIGVALGIVLRPSGWGWTFALCAAGALSIAVGVRERTRGRKVLVKLRAGVSNPE